MGLRDRKINKIFSKKNTTSLDKIKNMDINKLRGDFLKDVEEFKKCVTKIGKLKKEKSISDEWLIETKEVLDKLKNNSSEQDIMKALDELVGSKGRNAPSRALGIQLDYWSNLLEHWKESNALNEMRVKSNANTNQDKKDEDKKLRTGASVQALKELCRDNIGWDSLKPMADAVARKLYVSCVEKFGKIGPAEMEFLGKYFNKDGKSFAPQVEEHLKKSNTGRALENMKDEVKSGCIKILGEEKGRDLLIGKWQKWLTKLDASAKLKQYVRFNRWLSKAPVKNITDWYRVLRSSMWRPLLEKEDNKAKVLKWLETRWPVMVTRNKPLDITDLATSLAAWLRKK